MASVNFRSPKEKFYLVLGLIIFFYLLVVGLLGLAWYSSQLSFHFQFFDDLAEWKQMDKLGHFFTAFQVSILSSRLFTWTNYLDEKKSQKIGTWVAFFLVSTVEIPDGFSRDYGASVYDVVANGLGCLTFFLQNRLWNRLRIFSKFSAHLTGFAVRQPSLLGDGFFQRLLKDYNGQTYWFSVPLDAIKLPRWLCLAVGVGAAGMVRGRDEQNELLQFAPYRRFLISLDLNFDAINTRSAFLKSALSILNIIKIPAPAIELSLRGVRFYAFYF